MPLAVPLRTSPRQDLAEIVQAAALALDKKELPVLELVAV
jgi:hypothetical protein